MIDTVEKIIDRILNDHSLATLFLGVFIAVIASVDRLPLTNPPLVINSTSRIGLWAVAVILIISAVWKLFIAKSEPTNPKPDVDYGIKITQCSVIRNSEFGKDQYDVSVKGEFKNQPPDESLWLFHVDNNQYWPQGQVTIKNEQIWSGKVIVGHNPQQATIMVATVGKAGKILCKYYENVKKESGQYIPLEELTEDIKPFDHQDIPMGQGTYNF
ncbi:hypothetical protein PCC7424_1127 [Gloeothece citriformis PCC 7424]|uniref:Uncharacterized protein n=1 Tax=Gloeothece citriformis (strain PCC 7424) TaxID=65393 RepID=B7KJX9_GLOC7|nr:hypothetical protein [Gloeothece citriformis]ACK69578.1 hypothetical protein PCC7424_1127 [Gloeothece citriformis PCC 7424]